MGLDITAYSNLRAVSFPRSFAGIPVLATSTGWGGESTFLEGGCYEVTDATETHGFRAGSYGGYNRWRHDLGALFNPFQQDYNGLTEPDPDKPFYELIWFADNEGCIGPEAAAELLKDFEAHHSQAKEAGLDEWDVYTNFMRACELAANSGLIDFH